MTMFLLIPPASEPILLAEAKAWLRVDTSSEDAAIASLITTARGIVETHTGRALVTQTWRIVRDAWPDSVLSSAYRAVANCCVAALPLPLTPISSISGVRVFDAAGTAQTMAAGTYQLLATPDAPRLLFSASPPAPGRIAAGIEIDVVAGYGAPADVPQPLRQAILMLVARLYEDRGDGDAPNPGAPRGAAAALIAPFRRARLT